MFEEDENQDHINHPDEPAHQGNGDGDEDG
jgi:hypothetical protein